MVWLLLGIGLLLVIFNIKAMNKEKNSFNLVLNNTEEDMKEFDFKLADLRREFSETILELQKEIEEIKENYIYESEISVNNLTENNIGKNNIIETKDIEKINEEYNKDNLNKEEEKAKDIKENTKEGQVNKDDNNIKIDEINNLLAEGYSIEDISQKLGIGKGEVLLIKELYIK